MPGLATLTPWTPEWPHSHPHAGSHSSRISPSSQSSSPPLSSHPLPGLQDPKAKQFLHHTPQCWWKRKIWRAPVAGNLPVEPPAAACEGLSVRTKGKHGSGSSSSENSASTSPTAAGTDPWQSWRAHRASQTTFLTKHKTSVPQKRLFCAKKSTQRMRSSCCPERRNKGGQEAFPTQDLLIPPEASLKVALHLSGTFQAEGQHLPPPSASPSLGFPLPKRGKKKTPKNPKEQHTAINTS